MTPERWGQIKAVLEGTLESPPENRMAFLAEVCDGDGELRAEVESLLVFEAKSETFMEEPLFGRFDSRGEEHAEGQRVGPYRVLHEIGRGGMGAVYLAVRADEEFEHRVALKVVGLGMGTEIVRHFRAERQILAHLDHPNIAKLFDGGTTEDGRPYFIMEYIEGLRIDEACQRLPLRQRLAIFQEVCAAVHFAHQNLVVHRDLKPSNILVTADGVPKLLDFGIAKLLDPGRSDPAMSELGLRPMTLSYASPEQVRQEAITTASDLYGLGVLLHVLLTGRSPYEAEDRMALERAIVEGKTTRPSTAATSPAEARRLAGDLDTIVLRAMHLEPGRRYASAEQLAADIQRHLDGLPVLARKDTPGYRMGKFVRRHKLGVGAAAAGLLLVLGFSVTVTLLLQRAQRERDRAEEVSGFMEDLFTIPDPGRSRGETVTVREMLDRGRKQIAEDLKEAPETRAALMETMGRVYRRLGLLEPARELLAESLRVRRATLGKDNLDVASSLQNLALVMRELDRGREAESLLAEAMAIRRRRGDTESPEYASGINDLAAFKEATGEYAAAEDLYKEALALKKQLLGPENEEVARGLNNLAQFRHVRGDLTAAEPLYREALAMRRRVLGEPHPEIATSLNNLASLLEDRGDWPKAERLYREALTMRRKVFGDRHLKVAQSLNNLAFILIAEGRPEAAVPLGREALFLADELLPQDHSTRGIFRRNLAAGLTDQGNGKEGEILVREALAIFSESKPPPWRIADAESVLGGCLAVQGRFKEAEPLLLGSYPILKADPGSGARYAPAALQRIIRLYSLWGRPDRSAAYRALLPPLSLPTSDSQNPR